MLTKGKNKNMLKVRKMLLQSFKCNAITYFSEVSVSVGWFRGAKGSYEKHCIRGICGTFL